MEPRESPAERARRKLGLPPPAADPPATRPGDRARAKLGLAAPAYSELVPERAASEDPPRRRSTPRPAPQPSTPAPTTDAAPDYRALTTRMPTRAVQDAVAAGREVQEPEAPARTPDTLRQQISAVLRSPATDTPLGRLMGLPAAAAADEVLLRIGQGANQAALGFLASDINEAAKEGHISFDVAQGPQAPARGRTMGRARSTDLFDLRREAEREAAEAAARAPKSRPSLRVDLADHSTDSVAPADETARDFEAMTRRTEAARERYDALVPRAVALNDRMNRTGEILASRDDVPLPSWLAPLETTTGSVLESVAPMVATGAAGAATMATTRNPYLAAAAAGAVSYNVEQGSRFVEALQRRGVDFSDPASIGRMMSSDEAGEAYAEAQRGAAVVAGMDAATAGLVGSLGRVAALATSRGARAALRGAGEATEVVGEGVGELAAQTVENRPIEWNEVYGESAAAALIKAPMYLIAGARAARPRYQGAPASAPGLPSRDDVQDYGEGLAMIEEMRRAGRAPEADVATVELARTWRKEFPRTPVPPGLITSAHAALGRMVAAQGQGEIQDGLADGLVGEAVPDTPFRPATPEEVATLPEAAPLARAPEPADGLPPQLPAPPQDEALAAAPESVEPLPDLVEPPPGARLPRDEGRGPDPGRTPDVVAPDVVAPAGGRVLDRYDFDADPEGAGYYDAVAESSTDADEIAAAHRYSAEQDAQSGPVDGSLHARLLDYLSAGRRISTGSYDAFGDPNRRKGRGAASFSARYLAAGGKHLDALATELSEETGADVTEADIVEALHDVADGRVSRAKASAVTQALAERYKAVTGRDVSRHKARRAPEPDFAAPGFEADEVPFRRTPVEDRSSTARGTARGTTADVEAVREAAYAVADAEGRARPVVVATPAELPAQARAEYERGSQRGRYTVAGFLASDGNTYVVASDAQARSETTGQSAEQAAAGTTRHEAYHRGVRRRFARLHEQVGGEAYQKAFNRIYRHIGGDTIRAWDGFDTYGGEAALKTAAGRALLAEEYLAARAESIRAKERALWKKIVDTLRRVLKEATGRLYSEADIEALIHDAADADRKGGAEGAGVRFQKAPAVESEAFRRWFGQSKVVDGRGRPLRVFHGGKGDFSTFDPKHAGSNTGSRDTEGAFFFSASPHIASAYAVAATSPREIEISRAIRETYDKTGPKAPRDAAFQEAMRNRWRLEDERERLARDPENRTTGANVMPVYLSIQNPFVADAGGLLFNESKQREVIRRARAGGHDGVIIKNTDDAPNVMLAGHPSDVYVVFDPTQIKSATGNNGDFDPANPDIRYQKFDRARFEADLKALTEGRVGDVDEQGRRTAARLANPGDTPEARDASDAITAQYDPAQVQDRAASTPEQVRAALIAREPLRSAADVLTAKRIVSEAQARAAREGGAAIGEAAELTLAYREEGRRQSDAFRARADEFESPQERRRRLLLEAINEPIGASARALEKARTSREAEAAERVRRDAAQAEAEVARYRAEQEAAKARLEQARRAAARLKAANERRAKEVEASAEQVAYQQERERTLAAEERSLNYEIARRAQDLSQARARAAELRRESERLAARAGRVMDLAKAKHTRAVEKARAALASRGVDLEALASGTSAPPKRSERTHKAAEQRRDAEAEMNERAARVEAIRARIAELTGQGAARMQRTAQEVSDNFRRWFGQSKVVDDEGRPLRVFHGTKTDFDAFDPAHSGSRHGGVVSGAMFFTDNAAVASGFATGLVPWADGQNVMPVYLKIADPARIDGKGRSIEKVRQAIRDIDRTVYDGVIVENVRDALPGQGGRSTIYVAFSPTQIKSATGNNGDFDPNNPDIRYQRTPGAADDLPDLSAITDLATLESMLAEEEAALAEARDLYDRLGDVLRSSGDSSPASDLPPALADPVLASEAATLAHVAKGGTAHDKVLEYWRAGLLSLPSTHVANILGNTANFVYTYAAKRPVEALLAQFYPGADPVHLDALYSGLTAAAFKQAFRRAFVAFRSEVAVTAAEIGFEGDTSGKVDGAPVGAIGEGWRYPVGVINDAVERRTGKRPLNVGRAVRYPYRLLLFADEIAKSLVVSMEVSRHAYAIAVRERRTGGDLSRRIAELVATPGSEAYARAYDDALTLTFQTGSPAFEKEYERITGGGSKNKAGPMHRGLLRLREEVPGASYVLPFVSTPAKILNQGVRMTPLGLFALAYKVAHRAPGSVIRERVAEQLVGGLLTYAVFAAVMGQDDDEPPVLTGSRASFTDAAQRGFEERAYPPTSIRLGDRYYDYSRIAPIGQALTLLVDAAEAHRSGDEAAWGAAFSSSLSLVRDASWMQGVGDIIRAAEDNDEALSWAGRFGASFVSNIVRGGLRAYDGTVRDTRGDALARAFPGVFDAPVKHDVWGRPLPQPQDSEGRAFSDVLYRMAGPVRVREVSRVHDLDRLLYAFNSAAERRGEETYLPRLPARPRGATPEQYQEFVQRAGEAARKKLERMIARGALRVERPTRAMVETIDETITKEREKVRRTMRREGKLPEVPPR